MRTGRLLLAALCGTLTLFVWYGLAQLSPWGVSVVSNYSSTSGPTYVASTAGLQEAPPGTWTTPAFDDQLGGSINTLATDHTFSWVISAPRNTYSLPRYFGLHALNQALVASFLLLGHGVLRPLPRRRRGLTVLVLGVAATTGVYGGMLNWMGMPAAYGLGQCANHVVGWCLAFAVVDRLASSSRASSGKAP